MAGYNEVWDPNTPQGSESRSLGDDRIREFKRALAERLSTLMNFPDGNPLTLLPSVIADLRITDGANLQNGSISTAKIADGAITKPKIPDSELGWYKLNNNMLERLAYIICETLTAGQSSNHSNIDVAVPAGTQQSWAYPISAAFAPNSIGAAPAMPGSAAAPINPFSPAANTGVIINVNNAGSFAGLSPNGFAGFMVWQAYYDGGSLVITVANVHPTQSITVRATCGFNLTFISNFIANVNPTTHAYGNPGTFTPL
jgi:hypothetical protein